ncbi:amidohydrolase family protein [Sphingobium boeckii]|uniref:Imidazolonepropionase-like amidohydrolase n=1 Tax=Sphingobium boeckii TaxID=1082345 RepID=A0A7W9AJL4_9SPHN|nr:amidohydrolase family protein [Sphingobium boeckii]MBB5686875.1 imidazolonepropionase-like amidohydrolase [Sphingobium boeckii]
MIRSLSGFLASAALILATPIAAQTPQSPAARITALVGGNVIDIDKGGALENATVLIEGEKIVKVGPSASVTVPEGATVVPMQGQWLIPGMMNMHTHLGLKLPGATGNSLADESDAAQALRMADNGRRTLQAGVTTVRLTHEDHGNDFALKAAIAAGQTLGPRIETAGEIIIPTGGHGFLEADGPYEFAKAARTQIKRGATWIKIAISGGISDTHGSISAAPMTDEELSTLIEVAHRNGVKVTAHNGSTEAAQQALKFGIDCFEHGYHLNNDILRDMKAKGVWLVPTIVVTQPGAHEFYRKIGSPDWYMARVESTGKDHWAMLQSAIKLGVNIALGTDQFPFEPNGGTTATVAEAELYVQAGMTPLQALQAATIQPARMLGLDKAVGRIVAGQYADIVALPANPLKDISALRNLGFVMKGGLIVRADTQPALITH